MGGVVVIDRRSFCKTVSSIGVVPFLPPDFLLPDIEDNNTDIWLPHNPHFKHRRALSEWTNAKWVSHNYYGRWHAVSFPFSCPADPDDPYGELLLSNIVWYRWLEPRQFYIRSISQLQNKSEYSWIPSFILWSHEACDGDIWYHIQDTMRAARHAEGHYFIYCMVVEFEGYARSCDWAPFGVHCDLIPWIIAPKYGQEQEDKRMAFMAEV
jgi:hypothetical protein